MFLIAGYTEVSPLRLSISDDRQNIAIIANHALIILVTCTGNILYSSSDIGRITVSLYM